MSDTGLIRILCGGPLVGMLGAMANNARTASILLVCGVESMCTMWGGSVVSVVGLFFLSPFLFLVGSLVAAQGK